MSAPSSRVWRRALARGAEWRYFVLFAVVMLVPTLLAFLPLMSFFQALFDHATRADALVARLDSNTVVEAVRQAGEPVGAGIHTGIIGAVIAAIVVAPAIAGGTLALARGETQVTIRELLVGAAGFYARMLRMVFTSAIPLGLAGAGAAAAFHFASTLGDKAVLESSATHASHFALGVSLVLVWLADITVEAGRAHFVAQPERRSAFMAWWSGVRFTLRHLRAVFGLCLVTTVCGVGLATLVTAGRLHMTQGGPAPIALAFVLSQLAVASVAWGRSSRLVGLVLLIRAEDAASSAGSQ